MIKKNLKNLNFENEHLSEEVLLMLVDGELSAKESSNAHGHLKICWNCRGNLEKIEETITLFVDFRKKIQTPLQSPPPNNWNGFNSNLKQIRQEEFQVTNNLDKPPAKTNWFSRLFSNLTNVFSFGWRRFALACFVVTIAVGGWMIFEQQTRLSAKSILEESEIKKLTWQFEAGKIKHLVWEENFRNSPRIADGRYVSHHWSNNLHERRESLILKYDQQNNLIWARWNKSDGSEILFDIKQNDRLKIFPSFALIKEKMPTLSQEDQFVLQKHLEKEGQSIDIQKAAQTETNWMMTNYREEKIKKHELDGKKVVCVLLKSDRPTQGGRVLGSEREMDFDEQTFHRIYDRSTYFLKDGGEWIEEVRLLDFGETTLEEFENNELAKIMKENADIKQVTVEELVKQLKPFYAPAKQ